MGAFQSAQFNSSTTAEQAMNGKDLTGKVAVVTGANTGIGKETARVLLQANATVIMGCRSLDRGGAARDDLIASFSEEKTDVEDRLKLIQLDLGDLVSVKQFTDAFNALNIPCHYLIENAGVMAFQEYGETAQGLERQWGINHIGHYYLGRLMLPKLQEDAPSRLVALTSGGHMFSPRLGEWMETHYVEKPFGPTPEEYGAWSAYGFSKMSNILFAQEFNRRYSDSGVTAVSVHPGGIKTELGRNMPGWQTALFTLFTPFLKSIPQGAATTIRCVSLGDDEIVPGAYYSDCQVATIREDGRMQPDIKTEDSFQFKLWDMSEKIVRDAGFAL